MADVRNVCEIIVPNDLCIGCGLCAAICPPQVLRMAWNEYGEYVAEEYQPGCLPKCDLCLRTCPFWEQTENEDSLAEALFVPGAAPLARGASAFIPLTTVGVAAPKPTAAPQHHPATGYFLDCYLGASQVGNHWPDGASGGLTTWFLEQLLAEGIVDHVICVAPSDDGQAFYRFAVLNSIEAIRAASRSCYYPVEASDVLRYVLRHEGRYAITGLPCLIKAIRLAQRNNRRLRERIVATLGLVCGQTKSAFFVEYLAALGGGDPHQLTQVRFRVKDATRPATDYGFSFYWQDQTSIRKGNIFWTEGIREAWTHGLFKPNACNFCDDVFAETADVVFMDAWLPGYHEDPRGHTIVLNRSAQFKPIWERALQSSAVTLKRISIEQVVTSQQSQSYEKREGTQYRTWLTQQAGRWFPTKRVAPQLSANPLTRYGWRLKLQAGQRSRQSWAQGKHLTAIRQDLRSISLQLRILDLGQRIYKLVREGRMRSAITRRMARLLRRSPSA